MDEAPEAAYGTGRPALESPFLGGSLLLTGQLASPPSCTVSWHRLPNCIISVAGMPACGMPACLLPVYSTAVQRTL